MILRFTLAMLAAALLVSCTNPGSESSVSNRPNKFARFPHDVARSDCFFSNRIDNFEVLNETNLLVYAGRRRVYHVEISPPSPDLRHSYGIQFSSSTGRICGNPGERLQTQDGTFGRFPMSVTGVYRLDATTEAAVRAHFGQATALPVPPEDEESAIEELVTEVEETTNETEGTSSEDRED